MLRRIRTAYRPVYGSLCAGVVATLLVLLVLQSTSIFNRAELWAYDQYFAVRGPRAAPNDIVIVGMDSNSITDMCDHRYPMLRHCMAQAVTYLHRARARVIALDFLYPLGQSSGLVSIRTPDLARRLAVLRQSSRNDLAYAAALKRLSQEDFDSPALAAAIRRAGNVVVAQDINYGLASSFVADSAQIEPPVPVIAKSAARLGMANVPTDEDASVRGLDVTVPGPGGSAGHPQFYPTLAVQIASLALHQPVNTVVKSLPSHMLANYIGPQGSSFYTVTLESIASTDPTLCCDPPSLFRNKIVLIVPYTIALKDQFNTPYGQMYGGLIQATFVNTILRHNQIVPVGDTNNNLVLLILGLVTTLVASRFGLWRSVLGVGLLVVGYAAIAFTLFSVNRTWIHIVTPETAAVLSLAGVMTVRFSTEERQKRRIRRIFGEYLRPEVVEILVSAPDADALRPRRQPISVLFVDVRGFTRMSEAMEPEDVVVALDVYLEELTASVQLFDGTLDKYVGDELMAIWNAPLPQPDHAERAVRSALDMAGRMDRVNEQLRERGLPAIGYGIGVNSGEAVVGQMGSTLRKQYDVIGDTVNTAARLCSAAGRSEIIIGQETWEAVRHVFVCEETEPLPLKGKSTDFRTFRVLGPAEEAPAPQAVAMAARA